MWGTDARGRTAVRWRRWASLVVVITVVVAGGAVPLSTPGAAAGCTTITGATTITSAGCYVLGGDVSEHEDGDYITVEASDVVVDGQGYTLSADAEDGGGRAVSVDGDYSNVTVRDLTVTDWDSAIYVKDVSDATIRDVVGTSNKQTVKFDVVSSGTIDNVTATSNTEYGLYVKDATSTTVVDGEADGNGKSGVYVDGGTVTVDSTSVDSNTEHGIHLKGADGSTVTGVTASQNTLHGLYVEDVKDGSVVDSTADDNGDAGVRVHHSDRTVITNVTADGNAHGAYLSSPSTALEDSTFSTNTEGIRLHKHVHTVTNVTVEDSVDYGIYLSEPDDNVVNASRINGSGTAGIYFPDDKPENNLVYDNYLNNSDNVRFGGSVPPTDWNVSRRSKTNVVGGALVGGNFWAAPDGTGPSQQYDNADGDAFLDSSYTVAGSSTDALPLTAVTSPFEITPADHDFGSTAYDTTTSQTFTVESRLGSDVTVDAFTVGGADASSFSLTTDPSPVTLSTGEQASPVVELDPATTGTLEATLTVDAATDAYDTSTSLSADVTDDTSPTLDLGADSTVDEDASNSYSPASLSDDVGIASYSWEFGDGTTSSEATPSHTYADPGDYTLKLTVEDLAGNTATDTRTVTVTDLTAPAADAGANRTVALGTAVSFDASDSVDNSGSISSYAWDFGDGNTSAGETASNTYGTKGTYTVTLDATDAADNTGTDTATITVQDVNDPIARPGPDQTVDEDTAVSFDASASTDDGTIDSYAWTFGDGNSGSGETTTHTYADPGTYTVELVVDDGTNTGSNETVVTVEDATSPTVDAGSARTVDEDAQVSFSAATATDNVGVASYQWTFGDGNSSSAASPTHTYVTPGTYEVNLTLTDAAGNTASDSYDLTVRDRTAPSVDAGADLTTSVGESVSLDGSGTTDNVGVDAYSWEFGDGDSGTGATASHTYTTPGTYTATLTATDAADNSATDSVTVYVSDTDAPTPDTGGDRTVTVGSSVTFDASASTDDVGIESYSWSIGDDAAGATGQTTTYTFSTAGTYSVTLTVTDAAGNRASETISITAEEASSDSGGSGGGGGGGGGGGVAPAPAATATPTATPETTSTAEPETTPTDEQSVAVQTARVTDVTPDEPTAVTFGEESAADETDTEQGSTVAVERIGFTPKTGGDVSMTVTTSEDPLEGSPSFDRTDNTERLSNVRVDHSIANEDVEDVSVRFSVSKDRLAAMETSPEDVALYRHQDGEWVELPTTRVAESDAGYTFEAASPGLSEFAVGAKQPKFTLQTVDVDVSRITVGDEVRVLVRITNEGGADGNFVASLLLNGEVVDEREVTIAAGGRRQMRFTRPIEETGTYEVRVNDAVAGEVIVTEGSGDDDASADRSPSTASAAGSGADTTGGVGVGALAGALSLLLVVGVVLYRYR